MKFSKITLYIFLRKIKKKTIDRNKYIYYYYYKKSMNNIV